MKAEDTICWKINRIVDDLTESLATGKLDIVNAVARLHEVRQSAGKMELALKNRKDLMVIHGIEEKYQADKGNDKPTGINHISDLDEKTYKNPEFEFIFKRDGEVVYQNKVYSAVFCVVEKITDISPEGVIDGVTQKLTFGRPLEVWYAMDQLNQGVEDMRVEILADMQKAIEDNKFADPEVKRRIIEANRRVNQ